MSAQETLDPREARFIWIDCEMTGLDIFKDELCEVGIVPTDGDLNVLDEGRDIVIRPSQRAEDHMEDLVRTMHTSSGLIDTWHTFGIDVIQAQQEVLDYIKPFLPKQGKALLAGNSVGSDKKFLDRFMPELMAQLHYRVIDVSTFKELARLWQPEVFANRPEKRGGHRALADIIESIDELKYYRSTIMVNEKISATTAAQAAQLVDLASIRRT